MLEIAVNSHFHRNLGLGLGNFSLMLYLPVVAKLYQAKSRTAIVVAHGIAVIGYLFLLSDVGRMIMFYTFTHYDSSP